jgi:HK97 family phage major capsid protein
MDEDNNTRNENLNCEYIKAFRNYLRKGMDAGLESLQIKAITVGSDPDGGYLVPPTMAHQIASILQASPIRQLSSVETITADALELIDDHDQAVAGWTTENEIPAETSTPLLTQRSIPTHELYAQPKATQKLVEDSAINIEAWLSNKIADIFGRSQNLAFVGGSGIGQPRGFLSCAASGILQTVKSGSDSSITADALSSLFYSLNAAYSKRASFVMNRETAQTVRMIKQPSTGQHLWQPALSAGSTDTLLGVPVHTINEMPAASAGSLPIALGDFQAGYQIVDRKGIRILRDPFTEKPFVKFYATMRVGGDVVDGDAIKVLRMAS